MLGIKPGKWTAEVVISRHNGLFRNATHEVQNAQLVHAIGAASATEILNLQPGKPRLEPDRGLDLSLIGDPILETYRLSRAPLLFRPEDVGPVYRGPNKGEGRGALPEPSRNLVDNGLAARIDGPLEGSNNWVVSGDRMVQGRAIMANDPHRALQLPSLRYWVHLNAPGWNVIGAGEPALPGVSVGHNERGAWGFTIFAIDQEDLYVYETDPANPSRYRHGNGWETMRIVHESIAVKGATPVETDLKFTRHGPLIHEDQAHHRAYALRAAWLEPGTAPYLASLRVDQARNWAEFREACRFFLTPSENMVWADVDGHIGWQAVGLAPRRNNHANGLLPVPGDGRYEWEGFLPLLELPHVIDPPRGWFASANQNNLPPGFPFAIGFQWTDPFRFDRIEEVLGSGRPFTLTDMMKLQQDELSLPARALVPLLRGLNVPPGRPSEALERLLAWDLVLRASSVAATIYVSWENALAAATWSIVVPEKAQAVFPRSALSTQKLIAWLTHPDERFGENPQALRDSVLSVALVRAVHDLERRLGPDMSRWQYGQANFKHVELKHPLSDAVASQWRKRLNLGPLPRGGNSHTVNSTSNGLNQSAGATFRIIADTGDWDRAVGTNSPGQSGDPENLHYGDLFEPWRPASISRRFSRVPGSRP